MNAEQRAVFQGIVYYYRENQVLCRYQATLKEAVDPALLQQALDAARPLAGYYFCHVVWEKREAHLEPNTAPCRVRQGSAQPKIPEETNDYLFSLGYEGNTVYLDWFHFLADGRGGSPFFTLLLKLYCNLRSNAGFVCEALASDPPYDVEQLLARYPESQVANDMQKDVLQIHEGTPRFQRLRLDRQSLVDLAQKEGVKPFSALMGLTCQAAQRYLEKNDLVYSYAADTRAALGVPHALYNCIASFQLALRLEPQARLHSFAKRLDHEIRESLTPERTEQGLEETEYPSFDLCLGENMVSPLVAQHRQWLKTIRHEVPNPKIPFKVAVYIRFFNQTKYRDEEYLERNKEVFRATLAQYPMWEFVGFYIDNGSTTV